MRLSVEEGSLQGLALINLANGLLYCSDIAK